MMAHDAMRERIRAARENPPESYRGMLINTLDALPARREYARPRYAAPIAAAVALALALALAGPPIAHAAMLYLERLFARQAQQISAERERPAEERAREMAEDTASYGVYYQTYNDITAMVEGMEARLVGVTFRTAEGGGYDAQCVVGYLGVPDGFDPAWIDYTLTVNGRSYAARVDDGTAAYRRDGLVGDDGGMYTPWQVEDGVMKHYLTFPVGRVSLDAPLDIAVSARLHTVGERGAAARDLGELRLAGVFNRETAAAQELERARAVIPNVDEYLDRTREHYEALALDAVPVNARYKDITVAEMSVMDGRINLAVSSGGTGKLEKTMMLVGRIRVDGKASPFGGASEEQINEQGGALTVMHSAAFPADPRKLPEQSVIYVEFTQDAGGGAVVFRYDWEQRAVTLPEDGAQADKWLAEERALAASLAVDPNREYVYTVDAVCEKGGATVTLDSVTLSGMANVVFSAKGKALKKHSYPQDWTITVDGLPVTSFGGLGETMCQFIMPMHLSELGDTVDMTVRFTLTFDDGTAETFDFAFALNKAEAQVSDRPEKR